MRFQERKQRSRVLRLASWDPVNLDPDAHIFESADYGIVGDYGEIVPALVDQMKRSRPSSNQS